MMFLLRTAFWLTVVLVLLPGAPKSKVGESEGVAAISALTAATAAVSDAGGFCDRQPHACSTGSQVLGTIGERAEAGARLVLDFVSARIVDQKRQATERAAQPSGVDTLTSDDLGTAWRGPSETPSSQAAPPAAPIPLPPKRPA